MPTFNLRKYLEKRANYEGAQGYWKAQTRAWQNCCKNKLEGGAEPQKAWQGCLDEYQVGEGNMAWVGKYASDVAAAFQKHADASLSKIGPYGKKIQDKIASGKTPGQAVMETLEECSKTAPAIPEK